MTSLLFIHGTGVRKSEYEKTFSHIEQTLHKNRPDLRVLPCSWGQAVGAEFHYAGKSVPFFDTTMSIGDEPLKDDEVLRVLWELLYQDPLYELRTLALRVPTKRGFVPGQLPLGEELKQQVRQLPTLATIQALFPANTTEQQLTRAIQRLTDTAIYKQVITQHADAAALALPIARALVATLIIHMDEQGEWSLLGSDATLRDETVNIIANELQPTTTPMGIMNPLDVFGWAKRQLGGLAVQGVSWFTERRRGRFTSKTVGMMGDILLYQGRGEAIREFIRERILAAAQTDPNIVVLAHSLGGIAAVDLLVKENLPVKQLITVGSQAPLFYEINALYSLKHDESLPDHFPNWLNIYDRQDFLSYIAAGVFNKTGQRLQVEDLGVDNRQPFPRSHSSYWANPSVWDAVEARLPQ